MRLFLFKRRGGFVKVGRSRMVWFWTCVWPRASAMTEHRLLRAKKTVLHLSMQHRLIWVKKTVFQPSL